MHGWYDDSGGSRYYIAELYIQIQDFKGASRYYNWFSKEFKDDVGFPHFNLFWALSYYQNNKFQDAIKKVYKTAFSNTYLIDILCGTDPQPIDKSELWGGESLDYARQIENHCRESLTAEFLIWLQKINESEEYKQNLNRFISLQKLIKDEPAGKQRSNLIEASRKYENQITNE